jgi:uncharacterized protein (TIGR03067 family)
VNWHGQLVLVGLLLVAAEKPKKDQNQGDRLQGGWQAISAREGGRSFKDAPKYRLHFEDRHFSITRGDRIMICGTYQVYPNRQPKAIDCTITMGEEKGKVALGIYELKGNELKWCSGQPGEKERPKDFNARETRDLHPIQVVWKRARGK